MKEVKKSLFQEHVYTPDFLVTFTESINNLDTDRPISFGGFKFIEPLKPVYVDVKGTFNKTQRSFSIDQKLIYKMYGEIIHKIVPIKLFKATFCPDNLRLTKARQQPRKHYYQCKKCDIFKEELKEIEDA